MNIITANTTGIDTVIKDIQIDLYNHLVLEWVDNIEGHSRVYINKKDGKNVAKYYIQDNDYKDVYFNDDKAVHFFFLTSNNVTTEDEYIYQCKTKIVFMVNLNSILGEGRKDEKARVDVIDFLRKISYNRFVIEGYDIGVEDVFRGLDLSKLTKADIQPLHTFSINVKLYYQINKCN